MGLDLTLLPFTFDTPGVQVSHIVLTLERWSSLWEEILEVERDLGRHVPEEFRSYVSRDEKYEESHYGSTTETPYGEPLFYVKVRDLLPFAEHPGVREHPENRAAWAYLAELSPETKVALYWN